MIGGEVMISRPCCWSIVVAISRWRTPMPAISVSPDSWLMVIIRLGSSMLSLRIASTSLGRSRGCFASTAVVTTGSLT